MTADATGRAGSGSGSGPGSVGPTARRPLSGRTVLVVGADDEATRRTALQLGARGAALVVAGRDPSKVLVAAGYAASSGGTTRVIEAPSPPLLGAALLEAATIVLGRPTDVVVGEGVFDSPADARAALDALRASLGPSAHAVLIAAAPPGGARRFAEGVSTEFERSVPTS